MKKKMKAAVAAAMAAGMALAGCGGSEQDQASSQENTGTSSDTEGGG